MEAIKDTVINVIEDLKAKKTKISNNPQALLKRVLTKKESQHIKFNYSKKGILSLYVDSSSWLYILTLQKEELLARINKKSNTVKDIRFRIGEIK